MTGASHGWPAGLTAPLPPAVPWTGGSETLLAAADDPWITPAEAGGFDTTPDLEATLAFLERLAAASPLIRVERFGRSVEGRPLLLVVASHDPDAALRPKERRTKARLLAQCGIHPGEIDGKDAGLMLLRDIALGRRADLLDRADWLFIPILNPDGHERPSPYNRPNQRGPTNQGWRTNAQRLNLNRDFMKLDAPEMRALIGLVRRVDPDMYIDLHVTDGLDYQYDITFGWQDAPYARSPAINAWLEARYRPAVDRALGEGGHFGGPLILARDDRAPERGLMLPAFPPRFSHGYGDARHLPTILVENHSLKPVRQRVLGTYLLLAESLSLLGAEAETLREAVIADRARRGDAVPLDWADAPDPVRPVRFHGIASETYRSTASGADEVRWLGLPASPRDVPLYGSSPVSSTSPPVAYWIPPGERAVIERLAAHGIRSATLRSARTVDVEMIRLTRPVASPLPVERRQRLSACIASRERRATAFPPGSVRVATDQPLGLLAVLLLEPHSPDSLFAWGMMTGLVHGTDYLEGYVVAPMADAMLARDPVLAASFETRLAADPAFAADPVARLRWFYERSPYADDGHLLYPIGRETVAVADPPVPQEHSALTAMFDWWNTAYRDLDGFHEAAFARHFTGGAELIVNGGLRARGPAALAGHFRRIQADTEAVEIVLPFDEEIVLPDGRIYTRHRAVARANGRTVAELVAGWATIEGGRIAKLDLLSVVES